MPMSLYAILLIVTFSVPLVLSFDKRLCFYKQWKYLWPSLLIIASIYILFDIIFTSLGIWGFNPRYHSSILIFNLPLEEWLFFLIVPYASIFLHESIVSFFPALKLSTRTCRLVTVSLIVLFTLLGLVSYEKAYTLYTCVLLVVSLLLSIVDPSNTISRFYLTFLVILIPFTAVNGILTGSLIAGEVVWYNNSENLAIRFLTIPVEDVGYGFSLILLNLMLKARLYQTLNSRTE